MRSLFADWEQGDFGSAEWADPEIELVIADGPQPGSWTGIAGMADGWRDFLTIWVTRLVLCWDYKRAFADLGLAPEE